MIRLAIKGNKAMDRTTIKDIFKVFLSKIPETHIFILDTQGAYLAFSKYHQRMMAQYFDVDVKEGLSIFDIQMNKHAQLKFHESFYKALEGAPFSEQAHYPISNDVTIQYQMNWSAFEVDQTIIGVVCTMTNISRESQAALELEKVSQYLNLFSQLTREALFYSELDTPVDWDKADDKEQLIDELIKHETVMFANDEFLRQLQLSKDQVVGRTFHDFLNYPIEYIKRDYINIMNNKEVVLMTQEQDETGKPMWIEGQYYTIFDEQGLIRGHFGVRRDVTSRVLGRQALEHSQRLMQYVIEHNTSAVAIFDKNMNYIFVSEQFKSDYELEDLDIIGKSHYDVIPWVANDVKEVHQRVLKGEIISDDEYHFVDRFGIDQYSKWEARPWHDVDGSIGGLILYTEIITEKKEQAQQLRNNELLLQSLFSQAAMGIAYGPLNNIFKNVNSKFCDVVNYQRDKLVNLSFESLIYEEDLEKYQVEKARLFAREIDSFKLEVRLMKLHHKMIWVNLIVNMINHQVMEEPYILLMLEDISDYKQMEKEMYHLNYHDQLTGLYNRRFYEEELKRLNTSRNLPISLIVVDADGLKLINDAFGHLSGDQMIREISQAIKMSCRADDVVARIGGDELVILLAKTDKKDALMTAERISNALKDRSVNNAPIGASIGVAAKLVEDTLIEDVFKEAEAAMYRQKLEHRTERMINSVKIILDAFFEKYKGEKEHAQRVSDQCYHMGEILRFESSQLEKLRLAAMMHDIGKVNVPNDILSKVTTLNDSDWEHIKKHSEVGYRILSAVNEFGEISEYVLAHHERWDGSGYPKGLKHEEIPLISRIIAVVDAFDTMIHDQHYSKAMDVKAALVELQKQAGIQFDPYIVDVFVKNKIYEA